MAAADGPRIAVAIPAHNEAANIRDCVRSLTRQQPPVAIHVSDNASTDATPVELDRFAESDGVSSRRIELLPASEHFVSAGRWLLEASSAPYVAFLAADDRWAPGYAAAAAAALDGNPDIDMVFPRFVWVGDGGDQPIDPPRLDSPGPTRRQVRALLLGNRRELANQVYGVFRREAFADLLDGWERGGERFASDYAAVVHVLRGHRSTPLPQIEHVRTIRAGQEMISRVGVERPTGGNLAAMGMTFVRLNLVVNHRIGRAVSRATGVPGFLMAPAIQIVRFPQWVAEIPAQLRGRSRGPVG